MNVNIEAMKIAKGSTIQHDGATYHVLQVLTVSDHVAAGQPRIADLMQGRGQYAYAFCKRGTRGRKIHLYRVMADGSTRYEQAF